MAVFLLLLLLAVPAQAKSNSNSKNPDRFFCGTTLTKPAETVALNRYRLSRRPAAISSDRPAATVDRGNLVILEDDGTVITQPNPFDLANKSIVFTPAGTDRFSVVAQSGAFDAGAGSATRLRLDDDDSTEVSLPFSFAFYGKTYTSVYVNTDGNLTFDELDSASTERNFSRAAAGPPRVAPLLADLNPIDPGRISVERLADRILFTWSNVGEWTTEGSTGQNTFQAVLNSSGVIRFNYRNLDAASAVVAVSPGRAPSTNSIIDYSAQATPVTLPGVIGEIFATTQEVDLAQAAQIFYQTHPDAYDGLIVVSDFSLDLGEAFAFAVPVRNDIRGIRNNRQPAIFDYGSSFGSRQRLGVVVNMGDITRYPSNPREQFLREANALSILAHEFGHRWLANLDIGSPSLLGRDGVHWSFLHNTFGSVMEGNEIEDLGGGRFRTVGTMQGFSPFDQYIMGLRSASEVPPWFVIGNPTVVSPVPVTLSSTCRTASRLPSCSPQTGVTISGTRRDVTIEEIISRAGARVPDTQQAQKAFRVAFILIVPRGQSPRPSSLQTLEPLQAQFPTYFNDAVNGRATLTTELVYGSTETRLELTSNGSGRIETRGNSTSTQVGYASLESATGIAVVRSTSGADIRSEAAIPAATLGTSFRVYAERTEKSSTGIALLNPGASALSITAQLSSGRQTTIPLAARSQKSQFIDELFTGLGSAFTGSLLLTSDASFGLVALRGTVNDRGEFIITTVPATSGPAGTGTTVFPQIADGSGYVTELLLLNPATSSVTGTLEFSFSVSTDRGNNTRFPYDIPSGGVWKIRTSGSRPDVQTGFASIVPSTGSVTPAATAVLKQSAGTNLNFEAGVPAARAVTRGLMFGVTDATHRSVLAIANRGAAAASVRLTAYRQNGTIAATRTVSLAPNEHLAQFLNESKLLPELPSGFDGAILLESTSPVYAITLRTLVNVSGAFLMTAMTVLDLDQPAPATTSYFPQLVDGGNFSTEFLLLNTSAATGRLQFFDLQGLPLTLQIR